LGTGTCNPPPAWPQPGLKRWLISLTGSSDTTSSARRNLFSSQSHEESFHEVEVDLLRAQENNK